MTESKKNLKSGFIGIQKPLNYAKIMLLSVSVYSFEPLSNKFKPEISRVQCTKNDFLYFTNISLFYTAFCVAIGFLTYYFPALESLHKFVLPTSIVLEITVTILFWGLFFINPGLVKAGATANKISILRLYTEFPKHLFPLITLLIEQSGLKLQRSWQHRLFLILFGIFYGSLSEALIFHESNYLYPFFRVFTFKGRAAIFILSILINILFYEFVMYFKILKPAMKKNLLKKKKSLKNKLNK